MVDTAHFFEDFTVLGGQLLKVFLNWFKAVVNIFFICITAYRKI